MSNAIQVIKPYCRHGIWKFDDRSKGLIGEAFVAGADVMMDFLSRDIPKARRGFNLVFSEFAFPGHTVMVEHVPERPIRGYMGVEMVSMGNTYLHRETNHELWLCPALMLYFTKVPKRIYAMAKPISR